MLDFLFVLVFFIKILTVVLSYESIQQIMGLLVQNIQLQTSNVEMMDRI